MNDLMHRRHGAVVIAVIAPPSALERPPYMDRIKKNQAKSAPCRASISRTLAGMPTRRFSRLDLEEGSTCLESHQAGHRRLAETGLDEAEDTVARVALKQFAAAQGAFDAVIADALNRAEQTHEQAEDRTNFVENVMLGAAALAVTLSIFAGVVMSLTIRRGLRRAVSLADAVALGDLHQDIKANGKDEIKDLIDSLDRMTANLRVTATMADASRAAISLSSRAFVGQGYAWHRFAAHDRKASDCRQRRVECGWQRLFAQRAALGCIRGTFGRRQWASRLRRGSIRLHGTDGRQHQAECRQRRSD